MTKRNQSTEAALVASRALVAISAKSMSAIGDLTIPQFRALVVLASHGPSTSSELASALSVHASTVTRMVDRLAGKGYVVRSTPGDRREVVLEVTAAAVAVIDAVSDARRHELAAVMARIPAARRSEVVAAFEEFAAAAGEVPDSEWSAVLNPPGSAAAHAYTAARAPGPGVARVSRTPSTSPGWSAHTSSARTSPPQSR